MINRLSSRYDGPTDKTGGPLASHVPGTTIGILKLEGILPNDTDVYDTPGLLESHQLSANDRGRGENNLPKKRMIPRTYRIQIGGTVHVGGVSRIDLLDAPQRTIYVTIWCSNDDAVALHTEWGEERSRDLHETCRNETDPSLGRRRRRFTPRSVGKQKSFRVRRFVDRIYAGHFLSPVSGGWLLHALESMDFRVWTHEGVQLETREALVPDLSKSLMKPGV